MEKDVRWVGLIIRYFFLGQLTSLARYLSIRPTTKQVNLKLFSDANAPSRDKRNVLSILA